MFGWLFGGTTDSILASTEVNEADILYAGKVDTATRRKTVKQLDKDGFSVTDISPSDVGEELKDQTVFYRHKMFTSGMSPDKEKQTVQQLKEAEEKHNIDFIQDPVTSWYHKDKNRTADLLSDAFKDKENVHMAETLSEDEAHQLLEQDEEVVAKPARSCCGNGVQKLDEEQSLEEYIENLEDDEYRLEEAVPHGEAYQDCRAIVLGEGEDATVLEIAAREGGKAFANNISQGGKYTDSGDIFDYEIDAAIEATEGLEVAAFDYMKTPDGEIVGLEVNSDMGTAINEEYSEEVDINGELTSYLEARSENEGYEVSDQNYADHLDVKTTENNPDQLEASLDTTITDQGYEQPAV